MRLFAAVVPPPEVMDELALTAVPLRALDEADRLRWTDRAGWHITLAFYGEVDGHQLPALFDGLADAARAGGPLTLRLAGSGDFAGRHLWAGVEGDTAELAELAAGSVTAGRAAGAPGGDAYDAYRPHLTLARARPGAPLDRWRTALAGFRGGTWTADRLTLMRSETLPEGARYTTVGEWPLGGVLE
ncbi:RNA 2',3'-cyclic phosphodiesterase [Streptomyces profundus]|uniref:RNA 2',3'-cyclic phosphodiesterase n=1 Tax=Streptomyces profundus TaxID=2867410 RepID=UPI001D164B05|nr:RNA 2',3'-cyclic phosphodiesterase [Streptomyces sp. MA3_2.13]UED85745.1 RNA 2',3'-cyclic phosphodiesterase [Streptomyces sp. MA3_2.13]